jgi:8-oxo-dGTP pyrophosphatase MutT (NUDIX family)
MPYNPYLTEESFFVATKVCLKFADSILVIEENIPWKPLWMELPGWKISKKDKDTDLFWSLNREVFEELWSNIDFNESNTKLFMAYKKYEPVVFSETPVPFVFLCYIHELHEKLDIVLSHEHASMQWITKEQIHTIAHWRWGFDKIVEQAFNQ